jgi:hypothetical protein
MPSKETSPLDLLMGLKRKYSNQEIPDEELEKIGYYKEQIPGGVSYKLIGVGKSHQEKSQEKKNDRAERMRLKIENRPFDQLTIQISRENRAFRKFIGYDTDHLTNQVNIEYFDIGISVYDLFKLYLPDSPVRYFRVEMMGFLEEIDFLDDLLFDYFLHDTFTTEIFDRSPIFQKEFSTSDFAEFTEDQEWVLDTNGSEKIYELLEREHGVAQDVPRFIEVRNELLNSKVSIPDWIINFNQEESEQYTRYTTEHGLQTNFEVFKHFLCSYIDHLGLVELSKVLFQLSSLEEIKQAVRNADFLGELKKQEKALTKTIREADIEEKKKISSELSKLKAEIHHLIKIKNGILEYCDFAEPFSLMIKRQIRKVQDKLKRSIGEIAIDDFMVLDGKPNFELDEDPGKISGDCTENLPLPFSEPGIALYNVKAFDAKGTHFGNIYLLETYEYDSHGTPLKDSKVWHLDAIQLPRQSINWNEAISDVFTQMGEVAQEEGIAKITVNSRDVWISNYDYIQAAVLAHCKKIGKKKIRVRIPQYNTMGKYSSLQGNGEALVVWENPDLEKLNKINPHSSSSI